MSNMSPANQQLMLSLMGRICYQIDHPGCKVVEFKDQSEADIYAELGFYYFENFVVMPKELLP